MKEALVQTSPKITLGAVEIQRISLIKHVENTSPALEILK